jgi:hypothetical protein
MLLGLCIDVVNAVIDVHSSKVAHTRICPANVYVFEVKKDVKHADGRQRIAKLTNFDDAKFQEKFTADHVYERRGDKYDPPETKACKHERMQFDQLKAVDLFALGVLVTETCQFSEANLWVLAESLPSRRMWMQVAFKFRACMPRSWIAVSYELVLCAIMWLTESDWTNRPKLGDLHTIRSMLCLALAVQTRGH